MISLLQWNVFLGSTHVHPSHSFSSCLMAVACLLLLTAHVLSIKQDYMEMSKLLPYWSEWQHCMYTGHQPLTDNHAWTTERNCDLLMMILLQSLHSSLFWSIHLSWFNLQLQQPYNQWECFTGPLESLVGCKHTIYIWFICWFERIGGDILNYGNIKIHLWISYYI